MENSVENSISHYGKQHQPLWKTEWKTASATMENSMQNSMGFPQNIKNGSVLWSNNHTSGYMSKENKITISERYLHSFVHYSIIYSSQDMERAKGSWTDEWMKKCEILPFATMERHLEDVMLSEINQTERQILHDLTCEILNKTKQTFMVTEKRRMVD